MEYSIIQIALVFVVTFIAAIDQFDFLESLYQPIVTGAIIGLILGDSHSRYRYGSRAQRGSRPCHSVRSAWSARRYPGLHAYVPAYVHGR